MNVAVIGAGLAGCEAAWRIARSGFKVKLYEMKPEKFSPAHKSADFAELVCSNSLRASGLANAVGLLKEEMTALDSLVMRCAQETKVPAGGALAVDREAFSKRMTEHILSEKNILVIREEIKEIPDDDIVIIASGPLTMGELAQSIKKLCGSAYFHFFDAAAPIVSFESINMERAYFAARYGKGGPDYINCPMSQDEYGDFYHALIDAETAELKEWDNVDKNVFEGCMPIEIMAKRGIDTLRFGPMKPVGLPDPKTGKIPHAVLQLRRDNAAGSMYNLVGCQTHLKYGEQKRIFSLIPGLENAVFLRYGVMHRNSFLNSPGLLDCFFRLKKNPRIFFAGQITGVEGYVESASSGLYCGINAVQMMQGKELLDFGSETATGALAHYVSDERIQNFQPMNINFGIINSLEIRIKNKRERYEQISARALARLKKTL